jgi:hypothetical protein
MVRTKKLRRDKETGLLLIDSPEDIPEFATDDEEVAFWDTHAFSERFWASARHMSLSEIIGGDREIPR